MKNWKQILALLLCLALAVSLCACRDDPDSSASPTIEVDLAKNVVEFSTGLSPTDVLLTVNGEDITADLFLYILYDDCNWLMYQYYYSYYSVPDSLAPFSEALLKDAADVLAYHAVMRQKATELGCVLTDEQKAVLEADKTGENLVSYEQYKTAYGLSEESIEFLATLSYDFYFENLLGTIPMPTRDQLDNYVYHTKHILLLTRDLNSGWSLEDGEIAAQRALAEDLLAQLRAVEGEERLELFDKLMDEYSEDGRDENGELYADHYESVLGEMVSGYEQGSLALEIGELSGIVESVYGFHIILRQELEFQEATLEEYMEHYRAYLLEQKIEEEWMPNVEITLADDLLATIDIDHFFDYYYAYFDTSLAQE